MTEYREELISPEGRSVTSTSPVETNNLIYGSGYRKAEDVKDQPDTKPEAKSEPAKTDSPKLDAPKLPYNVGGQVTP